MIAAVAWVLRWLAGGMVAGWLTARVRGRQETPLRGRDVAAVALGAWLAGYLRGRADEAISWLRAGGR